MKPIAHDDALLGRPGRRLLLALVLPAALALATVLTAGRVEAGGLPDSGSDSTACPTPEAAVTVPGAEVQDADCLQDLTTTGTQATNHTNRDDWSGLNASGTRNPSGVGGLQVDGYFPDTSRTNTNNGFNHDSQFVIRFPNDWNGKLVITGAPGVRRQYAADFIIGDYVLAKGYAFASTDKGNTGANFYDDGSEPGGSVAEWHRRVEELTRATKVAAERNYGRAPERTYITGISNGGYLTRYALENTPELYDGGVDWEGTLFRAEGPNLFTYLPTALANYPRYASTGDREAYGNIVEAGFAPDSEFLWRDYYAIYWDLTQRVYREEFDPDYDGALKAGVPFCQPGTPNCDADYDYYDRPAEVREAIEKIQLTGEIGKPMLTLHGTLDTLLPIRTDSDVYRGLIERAGNAELHRYYRIEAGDHVDSFYDRYPDRLRPILPCHRDAFEALEGWVEEGAAPPESGDVPKPESGDVVNNCDLNATAAPTPEPQPQPQPEPQPEPQPQRCTITGTRGNDFLRGTGRDDVICGLGGNDAIDGRGGNDTIKGGSGNDPIRGGAGDDVLDGGSGNDPLSGEDGRDTLVGGLGKDSLKGGNGNDRLNARDGVRANDAADGGPGRDACRADRRDAVTGCP